MYHLKIDDALLLVVPPEFVPQVSLPQGMDPIQSAERHISLVSKRGMRAIAKYRDQMILGGVAPPVPLLGDARVVYRAPKDDRPEMAVFAAPVVNQQELRDFVNQLFQSWGLRNPEPKFFYHFTLGNNAGGHPRGSIAYMNPSDFQGPAPLTSRTFAQRVDTLALDLLQKPTLHP